MNCQTAQNLLNSYADGELDLINHLQIEEHLKSCPTCEKVSTNLSKTKSAVKDSLYFNAPPDLRKRIQTAVRREAAEPERTNRFRRWLVFGAAPAAVCALIISGLIFFQSSRNDDDTLANEVVSSHIRSMMANHLTDVPSSDKHTVKPWFEGKLDFAPPVSDLTAQGFPLVGGRLDYIGNRPVAALVYRRNQHFINLFVFPSPNASDGENKMFVRQGFNIIRRNKAGMTCWAVSDLNLEELQKFSQELQK